jgi:hypothetical protein
MTPRGVGLESRTPTGGVAGFQTGATQKGACPVKGKSSGEMAVFATRNKDLRQGNDAK